MAPQEGNHSLYNQVIGLRLAGAESIQRRVRDQFVGLKLPAFFVVALASLPDAVVGLLDVVDALQPKDTTANSGDNPDGDQTPGTFGIFRDLHRTSPSREQGAQDPVIITFICPGWVCCTIQ